MTQKTIKALLIEDNPDVVDILREELVEASHETIELECEERLSTGLKRLKEGDIDVVLLDISLPDSYGLDTFTKVHACAPKIPIIVLTNFDNDMFAIKAVKEGAQDYLVKGNVDGESLVRSIRYAIERHQKLNEFKPAQSPKPRSFLKFWKDSKPLTGIQKNGGLDGIYSIKQFRVIVERERTRVDRNGHGFSLVIFDIENIAESVSPDYLIQIVFSRKLRPTDEIGWFDKQNIGVLLHNTGAEGAWSFSNKIREIITVKGPPPDCSVYSYPSDTLEVVAGISIKRKNERFNVQTKSSISLGDKGPKDFETDLLTNNISAGGLFLKTSHPLPIGTTLNISLVIPIDKLKKLEGDRALMKVTGSVIRTEKDGMAISFDEEYDVSAVI